MSIKKKTCWSWNPAIAKYYICPYDLDGYPREKPCINLSTRLIMRLGWDTHSILELIIRGDTLIMRRAKKIRKEDVHVGKKRVVLRNPLRARYYICGYYKGKYLYEKPQINLSVKMIMRLGWDTHSKLRLIIRKGILMIKPLYEE